MSIITSIGLDHVELLGNTIQEITSFILFLRKLNKKILFKKGEKAGIVKLNVPCVIGPSVPFDIV